jgi:hypothetical protein
MQILAATVSLSDRLREIPPDFWIKIAIGIAALVATVIFLRKVAQVNKVMLSVGLLLATTIIGFNWIYERNEPRWATPAVRFLAPFFPAKGAV